jgi:branched-chain amino acid transport system ATP-binding protein
MLVVENLSVSYGKISALRGVSLTATPGKITVVLGSNGAGKSSLLRAITGQISSAGGSISFDGQPILGKPAHLIVTLGLSLVPEGRELFPRMTVIENLLLGASSGRSKDSRADLDEVFDFFPVLGKKRSVLARGLSGGEQQMLAFGRAIMSKPTMLLLDEPTIGLAPLIERELIDRIVMLARDLNIGIVLVEQNAALALSVGDSGIVLEQGEVSLTGLASDLIASDRIKQAYLGM